MSMLRYLYLISKYLYFDGRVSISKILLLLKITKLRIAIYSILFV